MNTLLFAAPGSNRVCWHLLFVLCALAGGWCEEPAQVTVCQLKRDPPAYNHQLIEVSGFVSHAFEDFTLFDPACPDWPAVWLEYGGTSKSGTMYCCGVTDDRKRSKPLVIENIPISLLKNSRFEQFDQAIQPPFRSGVYGAVVHATLVGRFFAGRRNTLFNGSPWGGFGHMGCCTLLAIQEIRSADVENRSDLDYGASEDQPKIRKTGCGYRHLLPLENTALLMQWQREADAGGRQWAFEDPQRVAEDALAKFANLDAESLRNMKLIRKAQGRKVYEWKAIGKQGSYVVVVSRPYWLSFYSKDATLVAWVAVAVYDASCGERNDVTRVK